MNFAQPFTFALTTLFFCLVIMGRYLLISGLSHLYFYHWRKDEWQSRKLGKKDYPPGQFQKEIMWSGITTLLFGVAGAAMLVMWQYGWLRVYVEVRDYPLLWLPVSLLLAMMLHDTAYYFLHRWMHRPQVYRLIHQVHHESFIPSAFTAFSFHPIEGLLQALILPIILMIVPMHVGVLLVYLLLMTASAVINHLDIELYPAGFHKHWLGKWLIGATHHSVHHKQFRYHFGLFFTCWDHWLGTESPRFASQYEAATESGEETASEVTA